MKKKLEYILYLITIPRTKLPNKYIGSKSNCRIENGKIYDARDNEYRGSAKDREYRCIIEHCEYTATVLGKYDSYKELLTAEHDVQVERDVVASPEYFNKSIATISNYSDPAYATYKHTQTGKTARLPRNHPRVKSGEWVGVTKGTILTENERKLRGRSGKDNPFYGKKHSEETKRLSGKKIGDAHRGKPKSAEQRRKMSEARSRWWAARKASDTSGPPKSI